MKRWWRQVRPALLGRLAYWMIKLVGSTLRIQTPGLEKTESIKQGMIVCGWHGKSFIPGFFFRKKGFAVVISHSRDGEIQNKVFRGLGYFVIRGSTGRGGVRAAVESIRFLQRGGSMAMTPDGPRGPSGEVQGGVMLMAQKSGAALIPVGVSARPRWLAPTWDKYMIPMPFARAVFVFGDPIYVAEESTDQEVEEKRLLLQSEIHRLESEADIQVGGARA